MILQLRHSHRISAFRSVFYHRHIWLKYVYSDFTMSISATTSQRLHKIALSAPDSESFIDLISSLILR